MVSTYYSKLYSVDFDLDRDGALLGLNDDQVVVVGQILNSGIDKASAWNNTQSGKCCHNVDFAVCEAGKKTIR